MNSSYFILCMGFTTILCMGAALLYRVGRVEQNIVISRVARYLFIASPILSIPFGYMVVYSMLFIVKVVE
ncbi:hypothetical protein [Aneurinibacillus tyrosinisolvens]|uniref:hypothetical protein n=1 Tax=Aneurinibacillus tyrosinisolvens TaxID=1443435 RepID=UPI00063F28C5|nr:hypothetical protein [Aneurinibacillus tyrosinisolvens]